MEMTLVILRHIMSRLEFYDIPLVILYFYRSCSTLPKSLNFVMTAGPASQRHSTDKLPKPVAKHQSCLDSILCINPLPLEPFQ